jgi:hypothetical protein
MSLCQSHTAPWHEEQWCIVTIFTVKPEAVGTSQKMGGTIKLSCLSSETKNSEKYLKVEAMNPPCFDDHGPSRERSMMVYTNETQVTRPHRRSLVWKAWAEWNTEISHSII